MVSATSVQDRVAALLAPVRGRRRGVAVALHGPAGIGKTFAAEAALARVGCRAVRVQAAAPWPVVLAALPAAEAGPEWSRRALDLASTGRHLTPADLAPALLARLETCAPLIVHVEDLHEASAPQEAVWRALAGAVAGARGVGLLVTSRSAAPPEFTAVTAGPLAQDAISALMVDQLGSGLPAAAQQFVTDRARGNPLFTREYLRLLVSRGYLWNDGRAWQWRAPPDELRPPTLDAVIAEWLSGQVSDAAVTLLAARTLLGEALTEGAWREVSALDAATFRAAQAELRRAGLLVQDDLAHPLLGDVALDECPAPVQSGLFTRAVLALQEHWPDRAARWLDRSDLPDGPAAHLLDRAARALQEAHDLAGAARRAVQAARRSQGQERADRCARALEVLGGYAGEEAWQLVELGEREDPQRGVFALARARLHAAAGRAADAERCLDALGDTTAVATERLRVRQMTLDLAGVTALWEARPDLHGVPEALHLAVGAYADLGQLHTAQALLDAHRPRGPLGADHVAWLEGQLHVAWIREAFPEVLAALDALVPLHDASGDRLRAAHAISNRSMLLHATGALHQAQADSRDAIDRYLALGATRYALEDHGKLGAILTDLGQYEEAEEVLLTGLAAVTRTQNLTERAKTESNLALLYLAWRPPHGAALARRYARAGVRSARAGPYAPTLATSLATDARVEALLGDPEAALQRAHEAETVAARCGGLPSAVALATFARGLALARRGDPTQAAAALQSAQAGFLTLGMGPMAHLSGAELDVLTGDVAGARHRLGEVEAAGFRLGADHLWRGCPNLPGPAVSRDQLLALGPLCVRRGGVTAAVRGRQTQRLFALLLLARLDGQPSASRLQLIDALYPGVADPEAVAALQQLVHRVRHQYGAGAVRSEAGGYALGLDSDAEAFLTGGDLSLWRGPFLCGVDLDPSAAGDTLRGPLLARLQTGTDPAGAARVGQLLLEEEAGDDAWLRACLKALQVLGEPRRLRRVYRRAQAAWRDVDRTLPADLQAFLAAAP